MKGCHTGFNVFFTTSVLWQIVNLEDRRGQEGDLVFKQKHRNSLLILNYTRQAVPNTKGGACNGNDRRYKRQQQIYNDRGDALNRLLLCFVYHLACLPAILCLGPQRTIYQNSLALTPCPLILSVAKICKCTSVISKIFQSRAA